MVTVTITKEARYDALCEPIVLRLKERQSLSTGRSISLPDDLIEATVLVLTIPRVE